MRARSQERQNKGPDTRTCRRLGEKHNADFNFQHSGVCLWKHTKNEALSHWLFTVGINPDFYFKKGPFLFKLRLIWSFIYLQQTPNLQETWVIFIVPKPCGTHRKSDNHFFKPLKYDWLVTEIKIWLFGLLICMKSISNSIFTFMSISSQNNYSVLSCSLCLSNQSLLLTIKTKPK